MIFCRLVIFFFIFLFFQTNLFLASADECEDFYEAVLKKNNIPFPDIKKNDLAIFFDYEWIKKNNKISIKRDKDDYPIVRVSLFEDKLLPGTIIKTIDGKDLSKTKDADIMNIIENSVSSEIEYFAEKEVNKVTVSSNKYSYIGFDLSAFFLNSINEIETRDGFFSIDYAAHFKQKRSDINEEGKLLKKIECSNKDELVERLFLPNDSVFLNEFDIDADKIDFEEWFGNVNDETYLKTSFFGLAKIRSKFDLKKYPFDHQDLRIVWNSSYYTSTNLNAVEEPQVALINPKIGVFISLDNYKNDNFLKEWKVKDIKIFSEFIKQKEKTRENILINEKTDQLIIQLTVQRNFKYYIYKVIVPVLLILFIAWSVLWIPANQIESRLTTSIVALLALIAYNFVFQDDVPKLDLLTSLDLFILLSYIFCAIPIIMTIYLSRFVTKNQQRSNLLNRQIRLFGGLTYILITLTIFYA